MKTLAEVKQELLAKGYEGEPTAEVLRQHGWEPSDPLANVEISGPARTDAQVADDRALLIEEAKANNVPAAILNGIAKLGKAAIGVALK